MSFWTSLAKFIKKLISSYNNSTTTTTTPTGTNSTTTLSPNIPNPSEKLLTAFLLPGKKGSKFTNSAGRDSTLNMAWDGNGDSDRKDMDGEREYIVNYLQSIKANCLPMICCNNDNAPGNSSYINPWGNGKSWGGAIPPAKKEFLAWIYSTRNDKAMFGYMCQSRGITQIPILFCSEDKGGPFSNPSWAEQYISDMKEFFIDRGSVQWICTHLEAEKFVTPDEVNRIAGLIKKYMPTVKVCVHATNTSFAKCNVDAVAVQCDWHPKDGDAHSPAEVAQVVKDYLNAGAKKVIMAEYNWSSENSKAKAQGQAALAVPGCIGVWNGW
jgi:hypothetical protein